VAADNTDSAACLRCGVCCFSRLDTYVRVTGDDWRRLGPDAERHAHFIGHRAYLRMIDGHCAALVVRRDPATGERWFVCSLYERRPKACRDLARGSPECEAELALKSERPAAQAEGL
jgi:Fe-S-cluster containining protein